MAHIDDGVSPGMCFTAACRSRRSGPRAALLASVLLLVACGSDDEKADSTEPASASTAAATTSPGSTVDEPETTTGESVPDSTSSGSTGSTQDGGEPEFVGSFTIQINAALTDPTSSDGDYPEAAVGAAAAVKEINDAGGVNGWKIELDTCDNKGDSNEAVNCSQRAIDEGAIASVGSGENSGNWAETLREAGIPTVGPYISAAMLADPNSYPTFSGQIGYFFSGLTVLLPENPKTIAVTFLDDGQLGAQLQALAGGFTALHPEVTINFVPVSATQSDYSSIVSTADQSDAIFLGMTAEPIVRFLQTAEQLGVDKPVSVPSVTVQGESLEQLGEYSEGLLSTVGFLSSTVSDDPAVVQFRQAVEAIDPDAFQTDLTANAYTAVYVVAAALDGFEGEPTAAAVTEGLARLDGLDLGLLPPIQFTAPSPFFGPSITRIFNDKLINVEVRDGQLVVTSDFVNVLTGE